MTNSKSHKTTVLPILMSIGFALLCCDILPAQVREWTDSTGRYKFKAELLRLEGNVVVLKSQSSGKEKKVPLIRLSDSDQTFVKNYLVANNDPSKTEAAIPTESNSAIKAQPRKTVGPLVVKRQPEKIQLDKSHFIETDSPPAPRPRKTEAVALKPSKPPAKNTAPKTTATILGKTGSPSPILDIGEKTLEETAAQVREWTDSTGRYKFKAELLRLEGNVVVLKSQSSGKEKKVPLIRLSDTDQTFVKNYLVANNDPSKTEAAIPTESNSAIKAQPRKTVGPLVVKRQPEKIQLDKSHFIETDSPPAPRPRKTEAVASKPSKPPAKNTAPKTTATILGKTGSPSPILDIGEKTLEETAAQFREWTDSTGRYKFKAKLVRLEGNVVVLKSQSSGKEKKVPLIRLSDTDQTFVKNYLVANNDPSKTEAAIPKESNSAIKAQPRKTIGPLVVKRQPEKIQLDKSHFIETDSPPAPKPQKTDFAASKPSKPASAITPKLSEIKPAKTKNAFAIPEIGEVNLDELARLPAPFSTLSATAANGTDLPSVRKALNALNNLPVQSANESLLNLLRQQSMNDDRLSRQEATKVLAKLSPDTCLPFLLQAAKDDSIEIRWQAYELLKELKDADCIEPLARKFPSEDRPQIALILKVFGSQAESYLHEMASHSRTEVRLDAVRLLGQIGTSASLDVLKKALDDKKGIVRLQAQTAIKSIELRQ